MSETLSLRLRIWRQKDADHAGGFEAHRLNNVSTDLSLLEMLDLLNEELLAGGQRPVAFEHDCREGICGSCGFLVNGQPHGCLLYTSPSPRDATLSRMPSSA